MRSLPLALSDLLMLPVLQGSAPARPATRVGSVSWAVSAADSGSTAHTLAPVIQVPKYLNQFKINIETFYFFNITIIFKCIGKIVPSICR